MILTGTGIPKIGRFWPGPGFCRDPGRSLFPRISLLKGRTMLVISWIRAPFLFSRKPLIKMLGKLNSCLRRKSKINIDNDNRTASRRGTQKRRSIWSDFQSEVQEGLRSVQTMTVKAEMKSRELLVRLT